VSYTVIRPGRLLHSAGGAAALAVSQGDNIGSGSGVARADVAALALAALWDEAAHRVTLEVVDARPAAPAPPDQLATAFKGLRADEPVADA
jgi:hypothetical protein